MVSLRIEEEEPMLPTLADEKLRPMEEGSEPIFVHQQRIISNSNNNRRNAKEIFKKLLIAVSLMLMGASVLRAFENYSPHPHHHHHRQHQLMQSEDAHESYSVDSMTQGQGPQSPHGPPGGEHGSGPHGPPPHGPPGGEHGSGPHGPPPHGPPGGKGPGGPPGKGPGGPPGKGPGGPGGPGGPPGEGPGGPPGKGPGGEGHHGPPGKGPGGPPGKGPKGGPKGHHGPKGPHGPHFAPPPKPLECIELKEDKTISLNLTISHPGQPLFLAPSLSGAKVVLESLPHNSTAEEEEHEQKEEHEDEEHDEEKPDHKGPPPPGKGPKGKGPHPGPHGGPHGKPSTALVTVSRPSADFNAYKNKTEEIFVCSLDLPFGQSGLGLFHEKPEFGKPNVTESLIEGHKPCPHKAGKKEEHNLKDKEPKKPKKPESFAPVDVKITLPAGPFTVTSKLPHPPPPHHGGPHHGGPPHGKGPKPSSSSWFSFWRPSHDDHKHRQAKQEN